MVAWRTQGNAACGGVTLEIAPGIGSYPGGVKSFLWYSAQRLLLLLAVGGLAYAVGMRGLLLIAAAFLGSGVLSLFVLRGSRDAFGRSIGGFFRRLNDRIDAASRAEDPVESDAGVGVQPAEQQVDAEVVEPEHAQADDR